MNLDDLSDERARIHENVYRSPDLPQYSIREDDHPLMKEMLSDANEAIGKTNETFAHIRTILGLHMVATAQLAFVSAEMTDLVQAAALTLPLDYEPRISDFGILPANLFLGFDGDAYDQNCWYIHAREGEVDWARWTLGGEPPVTAFTWRFARYNTIGDWPDVSRDEYDWQSLWAFFLIANQQLAHVMPERLGRQASRRALRLGYTPKAFVVKLRRMRYAHQKGSGESRNYSHRWMVNGHWRNQWYPGEDRHKPKYINPYVKGPEDKPIIVKNRSFRVIR